MQTLTENKLSRCVFRNFLTDHHFVIFAHGAKGSGLFAYRRQYLNVCEIYTCFS